MSKVMSKVKQCWWCNETFEEGFDIKHYKSGWLCNKCKAYLDMQSDGIEQEEPVKENDNG